MIRHYLRARRAGLSRRAALKLALGNPSGLSGWSTRVEYDPEVPYAGVWTVRVETMDGALHEATSARLAEALVSTAEKTKA
jgi:hypothetical protein